MNTEQLKTDSRIKERFENFIYYSIDGCWYWTGYTQKDRARFGLGGKNVPAARVSYALYVGDIPKDMCVCHHCDNPMCVSPHHLFLGTHQDNVADRNKKGRTACGLNKRHKLTEENVLEIRVSKDRAADIAKRFSIARRHVYDIKNRVNWKHI